MTANWHIVEEIWQDAPGTFGSIATITRPAARFHEELKTYQQWTNDFPHQRVDHDLYFSPLMFEEQTRRNDYFDGAVVLFADLDASDPRCLDKELLPSVAWETSPGMYQAVWYLAQPIYSYPRWSDLNRRMTYHTGADKGGWMGSKLLRVPGSWNFKRAKDGWVPQGRYLWNDHRVRYDEDKLDLLLPKLTTTQHEHGGVECPALLSQRQAVDLVGRYWPTLSLGTKAKLNARAGIPDRSLHIVVTARKLHEDGVPAVDAFHIIWWQPWNKWRFRNDPGRLWDEVSRWATSAT